MGRVSGSLSWAGHDLCPGPGRLCFLLPPGIVLQAFIGHSDRKAQAQLGPARGGVEAWAPG